MEIGKPGPGRPKGAKNKRTQAVEAAVAAAGITPLEFMLNVLQDDLASLEDRKWAANAAAPYVHAKLASVEVGNKGDKPFVVNITGSDAGLL